MKKTLAFILSAVVALVMVIMPASLEVNADGSGRYVPYSKNVTVYKFADKYDNYYYMDLGKKAANAKKITVKSSKKKVLAEIDPYGSELFFRANKTGKTELTIKVTKKSGTVKKYKINVRVKKYESPIKSIKIGKSSYTKKLGNKTTLNFKISGKSAKLSVKLKKGWKISKVYYYAMYDGEDENLTDIDKSYKNNSVIKFKNSEDYSESVEFTLTEKATGNEVPYYLNLVQ